MKQRIIYGVIAGVLFLWLLMMGDFWFTALIAVMAILGYREFIRLNGFPTLNLLAAVGYGVLLYLVLPWEHLWPTIEPNYSIVSWLYLFFLLSVTVISNNKTNIEHVAIYFLSFLYISFGFRYMIDTIWLEHGQFWALLIFSTIWATDTGAYFAGVAFGKRKLWPQISPKKTVEGSLGGLVLAMMNGLVFAWIQPDLISFEKALIFCFVISLLGQLGDLIQSAYKRFRDIKDSGRFLPGHGGILDRTDSWIIVFPFIHLLGLIPY